MENYLSIPALLTSLQFSPDVVRQQTFTSFLFCFFSLLFFKLNKNTTIEDLIKLQLKT